MKKSFKIVFLPLLSNTRLNRICIINRAQVTSLPQIKQYTYHRHQLTHRARFPNPLCLHALEWFKRCSRHAVPFSSTSPKV